MTPSRLTSQRQYFTDLNVFILCFDCLAAKNIDLFCILLLSINCSLNETRSCILHPPSKTTLLKLSKLKELKFKLLEFFCYLRTWSTQKANALSRQRLVVYIQLNCFNILRLISLNVFFPKLPSILNGVW